MKVVIVGAGGLVGSEFALHLSTSHDVLPFRHADLDITDCEAVARIILNERPALIINCAVLGVDASELDRSLAVSVNVAGAENLARAANFVDAEFLQLSSNYVFDGERSRDSPFAIEDAPMPINIYG